MTRIVLVICFSVLYIYTGWSQVDLKDIKSKELREVSEFFKQDTYVFKGDVRISKSGKVLDSFPIESIKTGDIYYSKNSNGTTLSTGKDYLMLLHSLKRMYFRKVTKKKKTLNKKQQARLKQNVLSMLDTSETYLPDVDMEIVNHGDDREFVFSNESKGMSVHYFIDGASGALKKMTLDQETAYYDRYELIVNTWDDTLETSDLNKLTIEYYITDDQGTLKSAVKGYELIKMEE